MRGHVLDVRERLFSVQSLRLQTIEGLIGSEQSREIVILEHVAACCVHAEERWTRAAPLNHHKRRPRLRPAFIANHACKLLHRRCLKQGGERQVAAERFFDQREQVHRQQRMAAQLEEVVINADAANV